MSFVVRMFTECGAVCVRGDPHHRQHPDCHNTPSVHVCLYWSAALQGTCSCFPPFHFYVLTIFFLSPAGFKKEINAQ